MFKYMSLAVLAVATLATETEAERRRRPDGQGRRRFQRFQANLQAAPQDGQLAAVGDRRIRRRRRSFSPDGQAQ